MECYVHLCDMYNNRTCFHQFAGSSSNRSDIQLCSYNRTRWLHHLHVGTFAIHSFRDSLISLSMSLLFGTSLCSFWGFDNRCVGIHFRKQLVQWSFGMKTHELKLGSSALCWFTSTYGQSASYLIDRFFPAKFFNAKFTDLKSRPQTTLFFRLSFGVRLFDDWVIHIVCSMHWAWTF